MTLRPEHSFDERSTVKTISRAREISESPRGPLTPALSPAVTRIHRAESLAGEREQETRDQ